MHMPITKYTFRTPANTCKSLLKHRLPFYSLYHIILIHIHIRILQLQHYYNGTLFVFAHVVITHTYIPEHNQILFYVLLYVDIIDFELIFLFRLSAHIAIKLLSNPMMKYEKNVFRQPFVHNAFQGYKIRLYKPQLPIYDTSFRLTASIIAICNKLAFDHWGYGITSHIH